MVIYDGIEYLSKELIPDFGSIRVIGIEKGIRKYQLLDKDVDILKTKVTYVADGSTAFTADTGRLFKFHEGKWYEPGGDN